MSNNKKTEEEQSQETPTSPEAFKISDDLIAVFRELVQLSLLTGTNIVDHMRAVRVEVMDGQIVPTERYVEEYNTYIEELERQADQLQAAMQAQEAGDKPGGLN